MNREVYIVDGARTPFLKARGKPGLFSASDLAVLVGKELLSRQPFSPTDLDEVIIGSVLPSADEANIARIISLRLGCGKKVPAWTVQRNCASGMEAIDNAAKDIACGRYNLILAGGTEAMSQAPLLFNAGMVDWLAKWYGAKGFLAKLKTLSKFKPRFFLPVIALLRGLTDHQIGYSMGQTAEEVAYRFGITREQMDKFSVNSHHRLAQAQERGYYPEIITLYDHNGGFHERDDGVRADSSTEKLSTLKPFFDKKYGNITAGNSSQVTDGASLLLLASAEAVRKYQLPVMGKILDTQWSGCEPKQMGLGPAHAVVPILKRQKLKLQDIDYWELNEAFAAQVLGCFAAWDDKAYCHEELGLHEALGKIDRETVNIDGGAIALGHPIGASGARIILHLLHVLQRNSAQKGIATLCIGGGQGGAMLLERISQLCPEAITTGEAA